MQQTTAETQYEYTATQRRHWLDYAIFALCLAGIAVAGYLTYTRLFQQSIVCSTGGSCDRVNSSEYAYFAGVPVAYIGLAGYAFLLACSVWRWLLSQVAQPVRERLDWVLFLASLLGFIFSAYLTAMELFVILAICNWCVVSAILMTSLFAIYSVRIWRSVDETV